MRDWFGVGADGEGSVRTLASRIEENNLQGPIPAELGNLANLTSLSLGGNELSGPDRALKQRLQILTQLVLRGWLNFDHLFHEEAPCSGSDLLTQAGLPGSCDDEQFTRSFLFLFRAVHPPHALIPPELGNLSSLTRLALWGNELGGPIPPELGNLASLTLLWGNELGGPIPPELGNLANVAEPLQQPR